MGFEHVRQQEARAEGARSIAQSAEGHHHEVGGGVGLRNKLGPENLTP